MTEREHVLKVWPEYFDAIESGEKPFEVRRDDRGFQRGDVLRLRRWDPKIALYTGAESSKRISYVLTGGQLGIRAGYVVLGLGEL